MTSPETDIDWAGVPLPPEPDDPYRQNGHHVSPVAAPKLTLRQQLLSVSALGNLPLVEPLVDGLLYRNTLAQLSGAPGSYKSFLSIGVSCALSAGVNSWEGHRIPQQEKVIYVAAEGASGLRVRVHAWCEHHGVDPARLEGWLHILPVPVQLGAVLVVDEAIDMVKDVGAGLVVLDTRARCTLGLEENSATEQGIAVEAADRIRAASDCTVWAIHHMGRSGGTPRGSTAWDGAVWSDLRLTAEDAVMSIKVEKHKDAPSGQIYEYHLMPHTVSAERLPGVPEEQRKSLVVFPPGGGNFGKLPTGSWEKVGKLLRETAGIEGLSPAKLAEFCEEIGVSKSTVYRSVKTLVSDGLIRNVGTDSRPRYRWVGKALAGDGDV